MFRKSSNQSSMFEVENIFPGALPNDDWSYTYKEKILPFIDEDKFKHFYSEAKGQPNASIRIMISLLIFMGLEKLTWRAVEFLFPRRLDWLNATNTPLGEASIDHTTIFKFYQRLELDDTARELMIDLTDRFIKLCGVSLKMQRTDSFFVHGWLRILTRYGLFKETIRKFLQSLRKQKSGVYDKIKEELSQIYLEKDFDLTEKDYDLAQRKVSLMAQDLYKLKCAFDNHKQIQHYETFKILSTVFTQQCEVKETADSSPEIIIKEKPDQDTICSPHNPEVRFRRKVKQSVTGDKAVVTETCDPENKVQFITDTDLNEATKPDCKDQVEVQDRLIQNNFKPEEHYEDAGFVNGETILESQKRGIELEGPTAGRSQSFETYEDKDRPFDAGDFDTTFNSETGELIVNECPQQQAPQNQTQSEKTGKIIVHFSPDICNACSDVHRCPVKVGKRVATYTVDEAEYVGAVRHHQYMSNPEYRKKCAIRAGAEATVSELTRAHGVRKSRHRVRERTKLQLIFASLACNVKRFIRYGEQYAYLEPKWVTEG
jgi:hypothetical protein